MKTEREIEAALKAPFPEEEIKWRPGSTGFKKDGSLWMRPLAYIDSRSATDRLDEVFGMNGWSNKIEAAGSGFVCLITATIDGKTVSKCDGSDESDMEAYKGGCSGSIVRAAKLWGVGKYLYRLGPLYADIFPVDNAPREAVFSVYLIKDEKGNIKEKRPYKWLPPELPEWALPSDAAQNKITKEATDKNQERLKRYIAGQQEAKDRKDPKPAEKKPGPVSGVSAKAEREALLGKEAEEIKEELKTTSSIQELEKIWIKHYFKTIRLPEALKKDVCDAKDIKKADLLKAVTAESKKELGF